MVSNVIKSRSSKDFDLLFFQNQLLPLIKLISPISTPKNLITKDQVKAFHQKHHKMQKMMTRMGTNFQFLLIFLLIDSIFLFFSRDIDVLSILFENYQNGSQHM